MNRQPLRRVAVDAALLCVLAFVSGACARSQPACRPCESASPSALDRPIVNPAAQPQRPPESGSLVATLLARGVITMDSWLPILGADGMEEISHGDHLLYAAGIPSEMFASKGAYSVVTARDFERARSLVTADVKSRPFVVTDKQLLEWVDRRAKLGIR